MSGLITIDKEYKNWLADLKSRIRESQLKASVRVNSEMIELYWSIGADIVEKQAESKWGSGVIPQLSRDLKHAFPDAAGYSERNLKYMSFFYRFYMAGTIGQQAVAQLEEHARKQFGQQLVAQIESSSVGTNKSGSISQICALVPWGHNIHIFTKAQSIEEALFYLQKTIENGWSRAELRQAMKKDLFLTFGKAPNNFDKLLPEPQSKLAREITKDPYNFDFITLRDGYTELDLEDALTTNATKALIELGKGFAYVGRQIPLAAGSKRYKLDLLFYHFILHCFIAVDLKNEDFDPKDLGQLGFYISAVNHLYKSEQDNPTIGLLICKNKDNTVAKWALESAAHPIGISEYELSELIPEDYKSQLPTIEEIEQEFSDIDFE